MVDLFVQYDLAVQFTVCRTAIVIIQPIYDVYCIGIIYILPYLMVYISFGCMHPYLYSYIYYMFPTLNRSNQEGSHIRKMIVMHFSGLIQVFSRYA